MKFLLCLALFGAVASFAEVDEFDEYEFEELEEKDIILGMLVNFK